MRIIFPFICLFGSLQSLQSKSLFKKITCAAISSCLPFIATYSSMNVGADDTAWNDRNRLAAEVWRKVDENYYDRTFGGQDWFSLRQEIVKKSYKSDEETYQAIQTMLLKIGDKYTRFLPPNQYNTLMNSALGELCGIGAQLELNNEGKVKIINLEPDSPASLSGLQINDVIINVDGSDTTLFSPEEVAAVLRGKEGTKASVRVIKPSNSPTTSTTSTSTTTVDYSIIRKPIKIQGVSYKLATINNKEVGIVKVKSFATSTQTDIAKALDQLYKKSSNGGELSAIILDLRNNAGGLLEGAVETANIFLTPGKIVVFNVGKDGLPRALQTLPGVLSSESSSSGKLPDLMTKLYILVNENSASAAEVLAAALKENGRATLVGHTTFGKGLIQTLLPLEQQGGIAVTTAKYETPLHHNINKIGLTVDIPVECDNSIATDLCAEKFL